MTHCIYFHRRKTDGSIFYVGQSNGLKRPFSINGRSVLWNRIVKKHGFTVDLIHEGISKKEANELEIKYIKEHGRIDLKTGVLCNRTDGADGGSNKIFSAETRRKMSISHIGKKTNHSLETRLKISQKSKGKTISEYTRLRASEVSKSRIRTPEEREKIRQKKLGVPRDRSIISALSNANKRPIIAIHDLAILEFDSMKAVENHFQVDRKTLRKHILNQRPVNNFKLSYS